MNGASLWIRSYSARHTGDRPHDTTRRAPDEHKHGGQHDTGGSVPPEECKVHISSIGQAARPNTHLGWVHGPWGLWLG